MTAGARAADPAPAAAAWSPLPEVAVGRVAAVEPGPILRLEDGRRLRPALVMAPPPEGRRPDWAPAEDLRAAVAALVAGRAVRLLWPEPQADRHGRLVGHVVRAADGLWVQERVLADGGALVMPFADEAALAPALLAVEDAARRAGRGLWADPLFAVRRAETVRATPGVLRLVAGRVRDVAAVRGTVYVNFGADWRTDFTALLEDGLAEACGAAGWEGRRLRVRGWLRRYNGPLIEVTACGQVEVLDGDD